MTIGEIVTKVAAANPRLALALLLGSQRQPASQPGSVQVKFTSDQADHQVDPTADWVYKASYRVPALVWRPSDDARRRARNKRKARRRATGKSSAR